MRVEIIASSVFAVRISESIRSVHPHARVGITERMPSMKTLKEADVVVIVSGSHQGAMVLFQQLKSLEVTNAPVFILTANSSANDRAKALEQGADECQTMPMDMREVTYRIDALLRRDRTKAHETKNLSIGELVFNAKK